MMQRYLYARKTLTPIAVNADQETINAVVDVYNEVTSAHKRAPLEKFVHKQLSQGESVELVSGYPRWSSALRFSGSPEDMTVEFVINPALPERFQELLLKTKQRFEELLVGSKDL